MSNVPKAPKMVTLDGNTGVASVAFRFSEVIAIYPITPSSTMGELADEWAAGGMKNLWGAVPGVTEMQSEAGAAGAVHGALQAGALSTTFTASQGLLLMIPNLYKIAGELTPFCMHVTARTLATHALSIFGDHSDVMACRATGMAMLASGSVQEAQDLAAVGHVATLLSRVPFMHFFDGFRTSHEVAKIAELSDDDLHALLGEDGEQAIADHRRRSLSPEAPVLRGTAQNPDAFFQAREASSPFHAKVAGTVESVLQRFEERTGRAYKLFDYYGHPEAERVMVMMGSGAEAAEEMVDLLLTRGEKVGLVKVRLFRPFSQEHLLAALPKTVQSIAVLDRTKEPGAVGEPLYQDLVTSLSEAAELGLRTAPKTIIGGRYGLSSKEFTPAMVKAVYDELKKEKPKRHFTIGIVDDVSHSSLAWDRELDVEPDEVKRSVFFGLGADGTVGANKNSIKIIGEETDQFAQGYFVYDSKKSGAITISHLRFGPKPIRSSYLIKQAQFVAVHNWTFLDKYDVLEVAAPGATLLLNSIYSADTVWSQLPKELQATIIEKKLRVFTIDAGEVARANGMGARINTIMQTCFFALAGIFPREEAISYIKHSIEKTYEKKGADVVKKNFAVVDAALAHLFPVVIGGATSKKRLPPIVSGKSPDFVQKVTALMLANQGDLLPVSAFPPDGTFPTGTARWEKRNLALEIPQWDAKVCIQCNKCAMVCPHAAIRAKVVPPAALAGAPLTFKSTPYKGNEFPGESYIIQVAPEDCTGCSLCVAVCPAKDKGNPRHKAIDMVAQAPLREAESANYEFFLDLPEADRKKVSFDVKGAQFLEPLFEYSGACNGCGETPYIKLVTQLFGDRALIANATGCSSIYGGNLPTTPYTKNKDGRGPAWANSLFEDNAEFGLGYRMAVDSRNDLAKHLLTKLGERIGNTLVDGLLKADMSDETGIATQRERVAALKDRLRTLEGDRDAARLSLVADDLVKRSVWIVGGDGWAYDIGYGGLDHVIASGRDVNLLVLDTEVYSNTGGQASKATPMGASAKFAIAGKATPKKDLGMLAMTYGHVYVAHIAFGAKDAQTVKALTEAESFPGPSLVIAYSHCIAHGYDLVNGASQQKLAVDTGYWPLWRYDPRRIALGESPLKLDSAPPKLKLDQFLRNETRFRMVEQRDPAHYRKLTAQAQADITKRWSLYEQLARSMAPPPLTPPPAQAPAKS